MSVVLELNPDVEEALKRKATAQGSALNEYVAGVLKKHIDLGPTLDEILAPVRKNFADSGMTEEELDEFMQGVRQKAFEERYPNGRR